MVDAELDLGHQLWDALDLIDGHGGVESGDETCRVDRRSGADGLVVERQDFPAGSLSGGDLFEQRALADLAGAEHHDNARIGQCRLNRALSA